MKEIPLTQGRIALVDDEDFEMLSQYKWHCQICRRSEYAARGIKGGKIYMHRVLFPQYKSIDHIDGNGLNNQKANLREVNHNQNMHNRRSFVGSSAFKGVYWNKSEKKWKVSIHFDGKRRGLGSYSDEIEAAKAYDAAAELFFGPYAKKNLP